MFARRPQGAGATPGGWYLDVKNGVWFICAALGDGPFPYRWRGTAGYGASNFAAIRATRCGRLSRTKPAQEVRRCCQVPPTWIMHTSRPRH
jgi:hypothetical protein